METGKNNTEFIPKFEKLFLLPHYWDAWLGVFAFAGITLILPLFYDSILGKLSHFVGRLAKGSQRRVQTDLFYCFPERNEYERGAIIDAMYASAPQVMVMMARLGLRDPQKALAHISWQGKEIIDETRRNNGKVIFLVPYAQGVDILAMLMTSDGQKMVTVFHNPGNPIFDYAWDTVCRRFGGRMHVRNDGIKPFIQSVCQGCWGYYLSSQDRGAEHSEFVDFFVTCKATLPAIGRLMKVRHARVVPLFPVYDGQMHRLMVLIHPPTDGLPGVDNITIARQVNEEMEVFVRPYTEQYT